MTVARSRRPDRRQALGLALLATVVGFLVSTAFGVVPGLFGLTGVPGFVLAIVLYGVGLGVVSLGALHHLDWRPDVAALGRRGILAVVGGTAALLLLRFVAILVVLALGLPVASNSVVDPDAADLGARLLALVPLSILIIGPAEELLFRGVVQRALDGPFDTPIAIGLASVLFALVHVPTSYFATPEPVAVGVAVTIIFLLSLVLGWLYARTDTLVVPALVHGLYNAVTFGLAYLAVRAGVLEGTGAAVLLWLPAVSG